MKLYSQTQIRVIEWCFPERVENNDQFAIENPDWDLLVVVKKNLSPCATHCRFTRNII